MIQTRAAPRRRIRHPRYCGNVGHSSRTHSPSHLSCRRRWQRLPACWQSRRGWGRQGPVLCIIYKLRSKWWSKVVKKWSLYCDQTVVRLAVAEQCANCRRQRPARCIGCSLIGLDCTHQNMLLSADYSAKCNSYLLRWNVLQ